MVKNSRNWKIKEHGIAHLATALRILQWYCTLCRGIAHPVMVLVLCIVAQWWGHLFWFLRCCAMLGKKENYMRWSP